MNELFDINLREEIYLNQIRMMNERTEELVQAMYDVKGLLAAASEGKSNVKIQS
jgi:hypothetical protein